MKLLECRISGFGAFKDYRLSFEDGLNVILQPNGWGKTTLAAYIKAMLYGFERKRVRDLSENERLRYMPWDGGKFGGTLDFELDGRAYRVLRQFGRTGAGDTVKVLDLDSGKPVKVPGEEVGEWVFGLDANAFQKSVFVGQNGFGFDGSTAGLRNRLNALVNEADDVAGLDKALDALDKRRKFYKKAGNHGAITDAGLRVSKLVEQQNEYDRQLAQMGTLQQRMTELDSSIALLADQAKKAQAALDAAQGDEKNLQTLAGVRKQLVERRQAAEEAYRAFVAQAGKVPVEADLEAVRKAVDAAVRMREEAAEAAQIIKAADESKAALAAQRNGKVPVKSEIENARRQLAELAHQMEVIGLAKPGGSKKYEGLDVSVPRKAAEAISLWPVLEAEAEAAEKAQKEIDAENAKWSATKKSIDSLKAEAAQAHKAVPEGARECASRYEKAAQVLRTCAQDRQKLAARLGGVEDQADAAKMELAALPDVSKISTDELAKIDAGAASCKAATAKLAEARRSAQVEESKLDGSRSKCNEAAAKAQSAQSALADAQAAKAAAVTADAEAKAAKTQAETVKQSSPAPAIACIAVGVVAAIAGVVLGPATAVAFACYAVAAVLVVAGVVLLAKKPSGNNEAAAQAAASAQAATEKLASCDSAVKAAEAARQHAVKQEQEFQAALDAQVRTLSEAKSTLESASVADAHAKESLAAVISVFFPDEQVNADAIAVQASAYKERLKTVLAKRERVSELQEKASSLEGEIAAVDEKAKAALVEAGVGASGDFAKDADAARAKATEIDAALKRAAEADARVKNAVADALGRRGGALQEGDFNLLDCAEAPSVAALKAQVEAVRTKAAEFKQSIRPLCDAFEVASGGETALEVERLSAALAAYRTYQAEAAKGAAETEQARKAALKLAADLDVWAVELGLSGREGLTDDVLGALAADAAAAEKQEWKKADAAKKKAAAEDGVARSVAEIDRFAAQYHVQDKEPAKVLAELSARVKKCNELAQEAAVADEQLADWDKQNAAKLQTAKQAAEQGRGLQAKRNIALIQEQREGLLEERSQCEERCSAILQGLEDYPVVAQEIRLLSQAKQDATAKLFTVLTAAHYLTKARENLDGRYLGGLTDRFNDYAATWLQDEDLDVVVGGDFEVAVSEGGKPHDVAGYSAGYQDLLDICLRMALVDTVFEGEEPFIVMDDPFVNLDQDKIARAMLLLTLLSRSKQIIYFTCHPSRVEAGGNASAVEFTLPAQRESREMPRARAKREAADRARAQAELVASYHVVPTTQGRAAVLVEDGHRVITNNLFSLRFLVDPASGSRDNAFEVHFIDGKGRALCERQIVEVVDGRVVPERLRFCLTTREDSGSAYDLIVHEQGKEPTELAARVTYRADISFNTEDFGF